MTTAVHEPISNQQPEVGEDPVVRRRILVVDDHPAVRVGVRNLISDEADFELVAAVASAEAGMLIAENEPIDVAVVDYQLRGRSGLWLTRKLKRLSDPPVVLIYSAYADGVLAAAAVVAEADAILSKGKLGSELCDAIRGVATGRIHMPPLSPRLADSLRSRLDHQEQAIFGMLLAGIKPAEVAATLGLSTASIESSLWDMLRALETLPAGGAA
jgi:DNA-binding NarL/FixJ family response regulator